MDIPTLMHNLKEEVTCSVCIHLYEEPKQLPCLHIFCLECLNDLARTSTPHGKIKCPLCQIEVAVPENGSMETLPDCFHLKNLRDILAIKECNTSKVTCGNCDQKSEDTCYCFNCGKFWCKDCVNAHNILRENKEHRVLPLKDFQEEDFHDVLKRPAFCPKELHEKGVFKFYCKVCEVPVCYTCMTLEHSGHEVEHLEIATRTVKDSLATQLDTAKKSCQTMSIYIRELEEQSRITERRSQIVKEQIQQTVETMISTLQQQERKLVTEVDNQTKEALEKFEKDKANFQDQLRQRQKAIAQVERLLKRISGAELVRAKSSLNALLPALPPTPNVLASSCERRSLATVFLENQALIHSLQTSGIGHLDKTAVQAIHCAVKLLNEPIAGLETRLELITRRLDDEQSSFPAADSVTVKVASVQNGTLAGDIQIKDRNNGTYEVTCIPKQTGEHRIKAVINGQEFSEFSEIIVTKRSFKPVGYLAQGLIDNASVFRPWGIASNESNEIMLSDMGNNRILVLNEKGEFIRSFGQHVSRPNGLTSDSTGRIFVTSRVNDRISIFNQNGDYLSTLNKPGSLIGPRAISIDSQGNIVVCDAGDHCVKIFSPHGNILKTIGRGWLSHSRPMGCLCYEGKIFVSDSETHVIKVYNSKGKFLYEFGTHGTKDGNLNEPVCLAVDKTGHLLVCCAGSHTVQVFTLDGKFVTKFGEHGTELGQFNKPSSALVLKNGRIVVCDFENNRLQLFE